MTNKALPEWGTRLRQPDLTTVEPLFIAAQQATESGSNARISRIAAHVLPPEGMLFAHILDDTDIVSQRTLQTVRRGKREAVSVVTNHLLIASHDIGRIVLGNRLRFN